MDHLADDDQGYCCPLKFSSEIYRQPFKWFNFRFTRTCSTLPDIPWQSRTSKEFLTLGEYSIIKREVIFREAYVVYPGRISTNRAKGQHMTN